MDLELGEKSPDGGTFAHYMEPPPALIDCYRRMIRIETILRKDPSPEGQASADAMGLLLIQLESEVEAAAVETAKTADEAIKATIQAKRVRPPTGSNKLEDSIQSRAIVSVPAGGQVGIADFDRLNTIAVDDQGRPYWRAQELGSSHLVGTRISGYFQPGQAPPDEAQFRNHPIFQPDPSGPPMLVQRPIPAKGFLSEGVRAADLARLAAFRGIEKQFIKEVGAIAAGTHSFVGRARRASRRLEE